MVASRAILLLSGLLLLPAICVAADTVVYPTGQWPADVNNVQAAVSQGGQVLLKATNELGAPTAFNFGSGATSPRRVDLGLLGHSVSIHGETVAGTMTTVLGGLRTMRHQAGAHVSVEIRGIHFEGPTLEAIYLDSFVRATIVGNVITNVQAYTIEGSTVGKGIFTWGANPAGKPHGPLEIRNNRIENVGGDLSYGIEVLAPSAATTVDGNIIRSVNSNGLIVLYAGAVTKVRGNDIRPGFVQVPDVASATANGIWVEGDLGGSVQLVENIVHCVDPASNGILVLGSPGLPVRNTIISDNIVHMESSDWQAIALFDDVASTVVSRNTLTGSGGNALAITYASSPDAPARNNVVMDNDVSDFHSARGDILIDVNAINSLLVRQPGTVVDLGVQTRIVP